MVKKQETKEKEIKLPKIMSNKMTVSVVICLVVGFIIGYIASSYGGSAAADDVGAKVLSYVDANFLAPQGAEAELTSVESQFGLYMINFDIKQDGEVVQQASAYSTKDGRYLIIGQVLDMNEELEIPGQEQEQPEQQLPKSDKPDIKMFVMTFCPFGQQAENGLGPAIAQLNGKVDWEPHFVIYSNYGGGGPDYCFDDDAKYCSMHGIDELMEGVRQLCIYNDHKDEWFDYVLKINEKCSLGDINDCWKDVAKEVGFDVDKVEKCVEEQGLELLEAEKELNDKYGVSGSPSIFINDADYNGGRSPGAYLSGICSAFNTEPSECDAELTGEAVASTGGCG